MKLRNSLSALLIMLTLSVGCTKKLGPDESLKAFVVKSVRGEFDREELLEATTGTLRAELESLNEEEMAKYLKFEGASHESFRINLKSCEQSKCHLTYTLKYERSNEGTKTFDVELKKIAELHLVNEKWLLADVTDIKTYYEAHQPIEP